MNRGRDIKELKHKNGMISEWFGPQSCGTKPSTSTTGSLAHKNTHSCPYAASSCFLVYMGTSVFLSMSSDWIDLAKNISPHLSTLLIFLFLFLSWINSLIWFITWTHKLLSQHNWGWHAVTRWQKWTPGGGVQVEEGTDLSMTPKISIAVVCFASWKHSLGLSQSI